MAQGFLVVAAHSLCVFRVMRMLCSNNPLAVGGCICGPCKPSTQHVCHAHVRYAGFTACTFCCFTLSLH